MALPIGSIIMWKNAISSIPEGWQICDGSNGTPDLRGKFVMGASIDGDVGVNAAEASHVHSRPASTSTDGAHQHTTSVGVGNTGDGVNSSSTTYEGISAASKGHGHSGISGNTSGATGSHAHTVGGNTNSQTPTPPFMKLYYIMRVS